MVTVTYDGTGGSQHGHVAIGVQSAVGAVQSSVIDQVSNILTIASTADRRCSRSAARPHELVHPEPHVSRASALYSAIP